ncbi:MAG: 30S ribosomal protein S8e [Ignisphaera sp.]|uniref:Small ribosomal subunit protein eS8 n=1 Tax=Ignisphaera aggregans TaxID=334771 RepID=A0A7J3MZV7_9CREN
MGVYQGKDFKKVSGGERRPHRDIRKYELGGYPTETLLSSRDIRIADRCRGGNTKVRLKYVAYANVFDPTSKTYKRTRILSVIETPSNRDFARRGIIVKGAIIQTELGKAQVISRPGQDGVINAILLK